MKGKTKLQPNTINSASLKIISESSMVIGDSETVIGVASAVKSVNDRIFSGREMIIDATRTVISRPDTLICIPDMIIGETPAIISGSEIIYIRDITICLLGTVTSAMQICISRADLIISAFDTNFFAAEISVSTPEKTPPAVLFPIADPPSTTPLPEERAN